MTSRMGTRLAIFAAVLAIAPALYSNCFLKAQTTTLEPYPISFQSVSTDVDRQGFFFKVPVDGADQLIDVHVFLVSIGQDYLLVDVGAPVQEYKRILSSGLRDALKNGKLRLVLLTHGHSDHVGALISLVRDYPDVQVVFHKEEAPFLIGNANYSDITSDNPNYMVSNFDVSSALPASRVLLLTGESGDISNARGPSGQEPAWQIPNMTISFHHSPGHAPGQVAYLHKPSGSLIAGDIFLNLGQSPTISPPTPNYTPNMTEAKVSLKRIANLDYVKAYCAHDRLVGVTRENLQQLTGNF